MKIPRATPGARDRAELAARAWLPVEENWKLAEVVGGRMNALHPPAIHPHPLQGGRTGPPHPPGGHCRRSGVRTPMMSGARDVTDLTTSEMSNKSEEELDIWTRVVITRVNATL